MDINTQFNFANFVSNNISDKSKNVSEINSDASIFSEKSDNNTRIIAHKGDSDDAPENTLEAYKTAVENGYKIAECDIRWTSDGEAVLLHDKSINRTARKGKGCFLIFPKLCKKMTLDELSQYDFSYKYPEYLNKSKITTLEDLLKFSKENNLDLYIDLKEKAGFDDEKAKKITEMVKNLGMEDNITWISTSCDYLKSVQKYMPKARLGYLYRKKISDKTIEELDSLNNGKSEVFLDIKNSKVTQKGVDKLHNAGYDFEVWTVNNKKEAEKLIKMGCKGITTDKLDKNDI